MASRSSGVGAVLVSTIALAIGCGQRSSGSSAAIAGAGDASIVEEVSSVTASGWIATDGAWSATHPLSGYASRIDRDGAKIDGAKIDGAKIDGAKIDGANGRWHLALHLARVGRDGAMHAATTGVAHAEDARVRLDRGAGVEEWFAIDARGLEQGIDLATRPEGNRDVVAEIAVEGLTPSRSADGASVALRDREGRVVARYAALAAKDATGRALPASMRVDASTIALHVDDTRAVYPIEIDPVVLGKPQSEVYASDPVGNDYFGAAVSLDTATLAIGANGKSSSSGATYLFTASGTMWTQAVELTASDAAAGDQFGTSVSLRGGLAVVGAPGHAVSGNASQGAVYVFGGSGASWAQRSEILATDGSEYSYLGNSVALDGTTILAGAPGAVAGSAQSGAAYVFVQSGSTWSQQAKLVPSDAAEGDEIGVSVALAGNLAIVGAPYHTVSGKTNQGEAYVFTRTGTTWSQAAILDASDGAEDDAFGRAVAVSGTTVVVTAMSASEGTSVYVGAAYVFTSSGATWTQQAELRPSDGQAYDQMGSAVAFDGTTIVAGAGGENVGENESQGAAYVFALSGSTWTQQTQILAADGTGVDQFGASVSVLGTTVAVGANLKTRTQLEQGVVYTFIPGHTNGDGCATGDDCVTGFCVDGVCCDSACDQQCAACNLAGTVGTCAVVTGAPVDGRPACTGNGLGTTCGPACNGVDPSQCYFALATIACGADTCAAASETHTGSCDYAGNCVASSTPCNAYACGATACNTSCASDTDCAAGFYCTASTCAPQLTLGRQCSDPSACATGLFCTDGVCCGVGSCGAGSSCGLPSAPGQCRKALGTACGSGGECDSGQCVDGVCCNSTCEGQCSACDAAGSKGTCTLIVGAPHGSRAACPTGSTDDPCSAATCDGITAASCAGFASSAVSCRAASCSGSEATAPANCDGRGHCPTAIVSDCGAYACDATTTGGCKLSCTADTDCSTGSHCAEGKCINGAACTDSHTSRSATGTIVDCTPYLCATGGECGSTCTASSDCVGGYVCDTGSQSCVTGSSSSGTSSGGCGVAPGHARSAQNTSAIAIAVLVVAVGRRRRRA
jgi:hypothetical protein